MPEFADLPKTVPRQGYARLLTLARRDPEGAEAMLDRWGRGYFRRAGRPEYAALVRQVATEAREDRDRRRWSHRKAATA